MDRNRERQRVLQRLFFSEGLNGALSETLKRWSDAEAEAKEAASAQGASTWKLSPATKLRRACRNLTESLDELRWDPNASETERLLAQREITNTLLQIFDLPASTAAPGSDACRLFCPNGEDEPPLPLIAALNREGGAPVLWVFEASTLGRPDPDESDPLQWRRSAAQFSFFPKIRSSAQDRFESDAWSAVVSKEIFSCDQPPRWVILAAPEEWVLIDRTKWGKNSCLRFDWKEITSRRSADVLNACAALLSSEAFVGVNGRVLLDAVDEEAHKQAYGVSESLKRSLRESIELLGNEAAKQLLAQNVPQKDLAGILTHECLRYMYRILFLLFVESRQELNYAPVKNPAYATGYAFESLRDLELVPLMTDEDQNGHYLHDSVTKLFSFFEKGTPNASGLTSTHNATASGFSITKLNGTLFDSSLTPNLNSVVFTNETLQRVIRLMSLSQNHARHGRKLLRTGRISYAHLGINQLGAVYEALLSYQGFFAKEDLYEVKPADGSDNEFDTGYFVGKTELERYSDEEKVYERNANGEKVLRCYPKGTFVYRLSGRQREKTASYYTPEILTQCVVKYALKEYFQTVVDTLESDAAKARKLLSLRICEPAMGSAAFLNEAINQLAVKYMDHAQKAKGERLSMSEYRKELQRVKMYMADNCVFGVDLNPVAVELAEVSLWLNALSDDKFVPWFKLQLFAGNSLLGCRRAVCGIKPEGKSLQFAAPREIGAAPLGEDEIWHFLVPFAGMADYKDPDVKALFPDQLKTLALRRKAFLRKLTPSDIALMRDLSQKAETLWQSWAKRLAQLRKRTTDPYDIYGFEAQNTLSLSYREKNALTEDALNGDGSLESGEFMRLQLAMNYWCALWFWPIDEAESFPTLDEFLANMGMILSSEVFNTAHDEGIAVDLFTTLPRAVKEDEGGRLRMTELIALCPNLAVAEKVADRHRFFHWPLRFADFLVNTDHPGFDLTFGNPPWRVAAWNSGAVIGDFIPWLLFKKESASTLRKRLLDEDENGRTLLARRSDLAAAWKDEFVEVTSTKQFFAANYDTLQGSQFDMFKVFLPLAWRNAADRGVQGFLHPMTNFTETKGETLRRASYQRLRYLFKFANEENLFPDVDHHTKFAVAVYSAPLAEVNAQAIMHLFHPKTVDDTFASTDASPAEGIKDENGRWNHKGQKDRLIKLDQKALESIGRIFNDSLTAPMLPDIHSQSLLRVVEKFAHQTRRMADLDGRFVISSMWHETNARNDGIIAEFPNQGTRAPLSLTDCILNGPHLNVGNPFFKTPNQPCRHNLDWLVIDLESMPDDFVPRCKYVRSCDLAHYNAEQIRCGWDKAPFDQHWRLFYREFVGTDSERTLTGAIYPPGVAHVLSIHSLTFEDQATLLQVASAFLALPMDAYIRFMGKAHLQPSVIESLPIVPFGSRQHVAFVRCLALMCLTRAYQPLWESSFEDDFRTDAWTQKHAGLEEGFFSRLSPAWSRSVGLRSDLMRRQALLELDVLAAQAMGLSLDDLLTLYRLRFRVMRSYEADTWYDQKGRIVFTTNTGLPGVGLPRKKSAKDAAAGITYRRNGYAVDAGGLGFEDVKEMTAGQWVEKCCPDSSMTEEPILRTIRYEAPFFQMNREADYREAWTVFEHRFGKTEAQHAKSLD